MSTQSIVPIHYDMNYITQKAHEAGVTNHFGHTELDGTKLIVYRALDFEKVQAVLDAYPISYAEEVLRPKMIAELAATRWQKQQAFTFNGAPMKSDPETVSSLTAAVVLMDANPNSPQTRRWKAGPGLEGWITLDRAALVAIGTAAAEHVQTCFNREEELLEEILEAETVDELREINIDSGWPA